MTLLQTKAMRERAEQRELRKYRFCLVRVRFPDAITLQVGWRAGNHRTRTVVAAVLRQSAAGRVRGRCSGGWSSTDNCRCFRQMFESLIQ